MAPLTKRERELLEIVSNQSGRLTTKDIYDQARMARATALKHLEVLEAEGFVSSEYLGSTKLWWLVEYCTKCGGILKREYVSFCPACTSKNEKGRIRMREMRSKEDIYFDALSFESLEESATRIRFRMRAGWKYGVMNLRVLVTKGFITTTIRDGSPRYSITEYGEELKDAIQKVYDLFGGGRPTW